MLRVASFHWSTVCGPLLEASLVLPMRRMGSLLTFVLLLSLGAACGGAPRIDPRGHALPGNGRLPIGDTKANGAIRLLRTDRWIFLSWCNMRDGRSSGFLERSMAMGVRPHSNPAPAPNCGEISYPITTGVDALLEGIAANLAVIRVREAGLGNPTALEIQGFSDLAHSYLQSTFERASPVLVRRATTKTPLWIPSKLGTPTLGPGQEDLHWEVSVDSEEDCTLPLLALAARWMPDGVRSLPEPSLTSVPHDAAAPQRARFIRSTVRFPFVDDHAALIARVRQNSLPFDPWFAMSFLAVAGATTVGDAWSTLLEETRLPLEAAELTRMAIRCFGGPWTLQVRTMMMSETSPNELLPKELSAKEQLSADALADAFRSSIVALRPMQSAPSRVALPHFGTYTHEGALRFVFAALGSPSDVASLRRKMTDPESKEGERSFAQGVPPIWNARIFAVQSTQFFDKNGGPNAWHVIDLRPNAAMGETEQNKLLQDARKWIAAQQARSDLTREESELLDESKMRILLFRPKLPDSLKRTSKKNQKPNVKKATPPKPGARP